MVVRGTKLAIRLDRLAVHDGRFFIALGIVVLITTVQIFLLQVIGVTAAGKQREGNESQCQISHSLTILLSYRIHGLRDYLG